MTVTDPASYEGPIPTAYQIARGKDPNMSPLMEWKREIGVSGDVRVSYLPRNGFGVDETFLKKENRSWAINTNSPTGANLTHSLIRARLAETGFERFMPFSLQYTDDHNVAAFYRKLISRFNMIFQDNIENPYLWQLRPRFTKGEELRRIDLMDIYEVHRVQYAARFRIPAGGPEEDETTKEVNRMLGVPPFEAEFEASALTLGMLEAAFERWMPEKNRVCRDIVDKLPEGWRVKLKPPFEAGKRISKPFFDADPDKPDMVPVKRALSDQMREVGLTEPRFFDYKTREGERIILYPIDRYSAQAVHDPSVLASVLQALGAAESF